jgi:hypothetical protein
MASNLFSASPSPYRHSWRSAVVWFGRLAARRIARDCRRARVEGVVRFRPGGNRSLRFRPGESSRPRSCRFSSTSRSSRREAGSHSCWANSWFLAALWLVATLTIALARRTPSDRPARRYGHHRFSPLDTPPDSPPPCSPFGISPEPGRSWAGAWLVFTPARHHLGLRYRGDVRRKAHRWPQALADHQSRARPGRAVWPESWPRWRRCRCSIAWSWNARV